MEATRRLFNMQRTACGGREEGKKMNHLTSTIKRTKMDSVWGNVGVYLGGAAEGRPLRI